MSRGLFRVKSARSCSRRVLRDGGGTLLEDHSRHRPQDRAEPDDGPEEARLVRRGQADAQQHDGSGEGA
jgi:hypothetical protein